MSQTKKELQQGKFFYAVFFLEGQALPDLTGLDDQSVQFIPHQDIAAAVSDYPVTTIKPLRKNLLPYHRVTKALAENGTAIPARFGQIAQSREEVLEILHTHYPRVKHELARLYHKVEMGVQVVWQVDNLFEYFIQQDQSLKAFRARLLHQPARVTRQEQIDFGSRLRDTLQMERERVSQTAMAFLRDVVVESKVDEANTEQIAMNGLFLVEKERQGEFIQKVEEEARRMGEAFAFKLDGPWVPFNFIEHLELQI